MNVLGLVVVIIFYLIILIWGIWASIKNKVLGSKNADHVMLAGRNIGTFLGIITMTATWVEGSSLNGTAESVFTPNSGLAWTQAVWGYPVALFLGGVFYAKRMRSSRYVTILDPFKEKYGEIMGALMYIPMGMGELFYTSSIISALGASLEVTLAIGHATGILVSAGIAIFYTMFGGLYSVVYTDVIQLAFIFVGLWLGAGFAIANPIVKNILTTAHGEDGWVGKLNQDASIIQWLDIFLLSIFGGIPWQDYFQRVLAAKTPRDSQIVSIAAAGCSAFFTIPAVLIGAAAKSADWNATAYSGPIPMDPPGYRLILPMVLEYLTPRAVSVIGLGALSAAVMSSADSALLSSSTMISRNIYKPFRAKIYPKKQVGDWEVLIIMRLWVLLHGALACLIAIKISSIYGLFVLCGDCVYVVAFPQLTCVLYYKYANGFGAFIGFILSYFFRLSAGEPLVGLDPLIKYPYFDEVTQNQMFPMRTLSMLIAFAVIIIVSYITKDMDRLQNLFRLCDTPVKQNGDNNRPNTKWEGTNKQGKELKSTYDNEFLGSQSNEKIQNKSHL